MATKFRALKITAAAFCTLFCAFAVFVWWSLQPRPDPQPMPAALTALPSEQGRSLLESADARADYQALDGHFQSQILRSFCGVASAATVLNAMDIKVSQDEFFAGAAGEVRSKYSVVFGGMTLSQFAALVEAHGVQAKVTHASDSDEASFRQRVASNLAQAGDYMVINYQREVLGQGRVGHLSPIAAYNRASDKVLILDTATYKYPATWVPLPELFKAMQTVDSSSERSRGWAELSR